MVLVALALILVAWLALDRAGARRFRTLDLVATAAASEVGAARAAGAMAWAPGELHSAETALRAGLAARRAEEARWWPLPDVGRVSAPLDEASQRARRARSLAEDRKAAAERSADSALESAKAAVSASGDLARSIHLEPGRRAILAKARLALNEAVVYREHLDFGNAASAARRAENLAAQVRSHAAAVAARYADAETVSRWQRWKQETVDWSRRTGRAAIVVSKEAHTLTLFVAGRPVKTYSADMGFNWIADKQHAGDGATPEGRYRVVSRKANGQSIYYKALLLDYPNAEDRAEFSRARKAGEVPSTAAIGGLIEIHGEGGRGRDWTRGCVAVSNRDMDELFKSVPVGTPVTIVGNDDFGSIAGFATRHRDSPTGR